MRKQLLDKFRAEKDKMPPEKRTLVLTHFPRFLSLLEEEIYSNVSPIWDPEFKQNPPAHVTAGAGPMGEVAVTGGKKRPGDALEEETEDMKRRKYEDENLEEAVAEIVGIIEDQNRQLGPQAMFPEHAPRDEAAKIEERNKVLLFYVTFS